MRGRRRRAGRRSGSRLWRAHRWRVTRARAVIARSASGGCAARVCCLYAGVLHRTRADEGPAGDDDPVGGWQPYFTGITWRGWGTGTATGTGTAHADNCKPNCAQGTYHQYPGTITLTGPKPWRGEMAYSREAVSVPAIQDRVTFRIGLLPGGSSPPPVAPPPTPGPVSSGATLTGSCVLGYEPAYNAGGGTVAYGPFEAGAPGPNTKIAGTDYTPVVAYQVTLTNSGSTTAQVAGWAVAFYDSSGAELGSDDEPSGAGGTFITGGQSLTWTLFSGDDTYGNGLSGNAAGQEGTSIPSDGTAASCAFLEWYSG